MNKTLLTLTSLIAVTYAIGVNSPNSFAATTSANHAEAKTAPVLIPPTRLCTESWKNIEVVFFSKSQERTQPYLKTHYPISYKELDSTQNHFLYAGTFYSDTSINLLTEKLLKKVSPVDFSIPIKLSGKIPPEIISDFYKIAKQIEKFGIKVNGPEDDDSLTPSLASPEASVLFIPKTSLLTPPDAEKYQKHFKELDKNKNYFLYDGTFFDDSSIAKLATRILEKRNPVEFWAPTKDTSPPQEIGSNYDRITKKLGESGIKTCGLLVHTSIASRPTEAQVVFIPRQSALSPSEFERVQKYLKIGASQSSISFHLNLPKILQKLNADKNYFLYDETLYDDSSIHLLVARMRGTEWREEIKSIDFVLPIDLDRRKNQELVLELSATVSEVLKSGINVKGWKTAPTQP